MYVTYFILLGKVGKQEKQFLRGGFGDTGINVYIC
jgi:hypothetical protein